MDVRGARGRKQLVHFCRWFKFELWEGCAGAKEEKGRAAERSRCKTSAAKVFAADTVGFRRQEDGKSLSSRSEKSLPARRSSGEGGRMQRNLKERELTP